MQAALVTLLVVYFVACGLGAFAVNRRFAELEPLAWNLELALLGLGLVALGLRSRSPEAPTPALRHYALLAYAAVLAAGAAAAPAERQEVALSALLVAAAWVVAFGLGRVLLRLDSGQAAVTLALGAATVLLAGPPLLEHLWGLRSMPGWTDGRFEASVTRATGLLANPIALGGVFQLLLAWWAGAHLEARPGSARSAAAAAGCALCTLVLYVTFTRAAWAAAAVSCVVLAVGKRRLAPLFWPVLLATLILVSPEGRGRVSATAQTNHVATTTRVDCWKRCVNLFVEAPIIGQGLGRWCGVAPNNAEVPGAFYSHCYPLQVAAELGLVGAIPFCAFMGLSLWEGWRQRSLNGRLGSLAAVAGCLAMSLVICHLEYRPLALLFGLALAGLEGRPASPERRWPTLVCLAGPGLLALGLLTAVQVRADLCQLRIERALALARAGRTGEARVDLQAVVDARASWLADEVRLAEGLLKALPPVHN